MNRPIRVLFVCLGNICRSPLAEGVFRLRAAQAGLASSFEIASAGTSGWHADDPPDSRVRSVARKHGVDLLSRGRQLVSADLAYYDAILAMDRDNLHDILFLDPDKAYSGRVRLFREYDPEPGDYQVPDPYYGGQEGFDRVYEITDRTCRALLGALSAHLGLESEAPD